MGRLIIDGNSVFEIDERCLEKKKIPKECDINKYLKREMKDSRQLYEKNLTNQKKMR